MEVAVRLAYRLEMCRLLDLAHRLHQRVLHRNGDITPRVALCQFSQLSVVLALERSFCVANSNLEHGRPGRDVGQADVHTSLETSSDGSIELPGDVCRAEHQHACRVLAYTVHLHQHFGLYTPRGLGLAFASGTA